MTPTVGLASKGGLGVGALEKRDMEGGRGKGKRWETSKGWEAGELKGIITQQCLIFYKILLKKGFKIWTPLAYPSVKGTYSSFYKDRHITDAWSQQHSRF